MSEYVFEGWCARGPEGKLQWESFQPKAWAETDVDICISHCGVCGSDLHTLRSDWGPTIYPCCVGHEIVGRIVRLGNQVSAFKLGDRVGVGAQSDSCGNCPQCNNGDENLCQTGWVGTYNGVYSDGTRSYGGYARYCRVPGRFVVGIPDGISSADAAPMLCAGATTYRALTSNGAGPTKVVGVVGIGGLGHFALLWAKALGSSRVVAISRTRDKERFARELGVEHFIATDEQGWSVNNASSLDVIISTVSDADMPLSEYLALLRVRGQLIQVGEPAGVLPGINVFSLIGRDIKVGGSVIASPSKIAEMLAFAAAKGVRPKVEIRAMKDAPQVIRDQEAGNARMRYVLVNEFS